MYKISSVAANILLLSILTAEAQSPAQTTSFSFADPKVQAAFVAVVGVIFSAIVSAGISLLLGWLTAKNTVRAELTKRQNELALKISDLVSSESDLVRQSAMRRFAVGLVKIMEAVEKEELGKVYFIPMNARVTVGRSGDNDIVLNDPNKWLSRWQCGFIADQHSVWIDDFLSKNGTTVGSTTISTSYLLKSGDEIRLGPFLLRFQKIRENTILSQ
jgi:hypothetical protein